MCSCVLCYFYCTRSNYLLSWLELGELYSVKIMWPRSTEQEARSRLTGFVCFTNRPEAEDAMEACDDTDPFNCGRRLAIGWGKNVKNSVHQGDGVKSDPVRKLAGPGAHGDQPRRSKPIRVMPTRDMRKNGSQGGALLTEAEIEEFHRLTRWELCAARDAICKAMAFCFEKSGAAKHIADMLKDLVMESTPEVSLGTRVARLFLVSDVLYNSQQPGVRNAFLYRDAIERMAPDVFTGLGKHGDGKIGRISMNKLSMAVSTVLDAWANWSVYNPTFLEELHARFNGREIKNESTVSIKKEQHYEESTTIKEGVQQKDQDVPPSTDTVDSIRATPRGDWTSLTGGDDIDLDNLDDVDGECIDENDIDIDGEGIDDNDLDGELIDDAEFDGGVKFLEVQTSSNPLNDEGNVRDNNRVSHDADGQPVVKNLDIDGIPLDQDDADGEPLDADEDIDGEPLDMDADGQPLDKDVDGIPLDQHFADGEPLDEDEDVDGEPFDMNHADREPL
jgi:RNA recognition motif-containing protein